MRFCPLCGKEIAKTEKFCKDCRAGFSSEESLKDHDFKNILVCDECGRLFTKNRWKKSDDFLEDVKNIIKSRIKRSFGLKGKYSIELSFSEEELSYAYEQHFSEQNKFTFDIEAKISFPDKKKDFRLEGKQRIILETCKQCSKKFTKYFEGILQIRNVDEELLDFLDSEMREANRNQVFITDMQEHKDGVDLYLTSKKHVSRLARLLQEKFGGIVKESEQHFSHDRQTSKDVYRLNAIFIKSPVKKGDVIDYDGGVFKVSSLGKNLFAEDLEKNNKIRLDFDDDFKKVQKQKSQVVKIFPDKEALDPETYESLPLIVNTKTSTAKRLVVGQEIEVVRHKKRLYLV